MEMKVGQAQKLASRDELSDEPQPVSGNKTFFKGGHWRGRSREPQFGYSDFDWM